MRTRPIIMRIMRPVVDFERQMRITPIIEPRSVPCAPLVKGATFCPRTGRYLLRKNMLAATRIAIRTIIPQLMGTLNATLARKIAMKHNSGPGNLLTKQPRNPKASKRKMRAMPRNEVFAEREISANMKIKFWG